MSTNAEITLVAQAVLQRHTYYLANRAGVTLDGTGYDNTILSVSDGAEEGNIGEGFKVGSMKVTLVNGETFTGDGFKYQVTDIWNNSVITIKRWESGDTTWAGCADYSKGLIKDFDYRFGKISFSVDAKDHRDDILLPSIKCEDNSELSDAEAQCFFHNTGVESQIQVANTNIFGVGELVLLTTPNGNTEYQKIWKFTGSIMHFYEDCLHYSDQAADFTNIVEKAFRNLPQAFIGKTLPIQIGDLTDHANGEFGKTITVNEQIGNQAILADNFTLNDLDNIGAWESGQKRFFSGKSTGEYIIVSNYKGILFRVDSTATLNGDIVSSLAGIDQIIVDDYTQILWENEDDVDWETYPELLSVNIIAIGAELMMVVDEPQSNTIYVERGYNNTKITTHSSGDIIYQCAKYSAKNLLSFTERFVPKLITNQYYGLFAFMPVTRYNPIDHMILTNSFGDMLDDDTTTYFEIEQISRSFKPGANMDLSFQKIEDDFSVTDVFIALKIEYEELGDPDDVFPDNGIFFIIYNPNYSTGPDAGHNVVGNSEYYYPIISWSEEVQPGVTFNFDTYSSIVRDAFTVTPDSRDHSYSFTVTPNIESNLGAKTPITVTKLTELNKKWKINFSLHAGGIAEPQPLQKILLYNLGFWVDFFLDFTKRIVVAPLKGREVTTDVTTVCGEDSPTRVGDLCENPVDFIALMLLQELGYATTDFDSTWSTVWGELDTLSAVCACSYGVDDTQKKGWEFCEWIASHFNLAITKLRNGDIDIVNLWEIYADTPAGTEIDIEDDVLFLEESSEKLMVMKQTGTDLIYNDIIVKYARNNSTGEYQKEYHLPDTYILENDMVPPINLSDARNRYYNGKKRTKIIESPFIYTEAEAQRKAEWEANNHACVNLWIEVGLDYNNTDRIGDVKYFTGKYNGVELSSEHKFFIQNMYPADEGRELALHCKSIQGVDAIVNPEDDNVILDTGGTSLTGDDIWNDTGGTGVTGDDVINDTGGGSTI